jgi:hypothetical protein
MIFYAQFTNHCVIDYITITIIGIQLFFTVIEGVGVVLDGHRILLLWKPLVTIPVLSRVMVSTVNIAKKRKQVNIAIKQLNWLLGRKSNLSIENELLIYKTITIPIWTYSVHINDYLLLTLYE